MTRTSSGKSQNKGISSCEVTEEPQKYQSPVLLEKTVTQAFDLMSGYSTPSTTLDSTKYNLAFEYCDRQITERGKLSSLPCMAKHDSLFDDDISSQKKTSVDHYPS